MISYELAQQLKDAGFPQTLKVGSCMLLDGGLGFVVEEPKKEFNNGEGNYTLIPTLSELIEACGDNFSHLRKKENKWECSSVASKKPPIGNGILNYFDEEGKTPEEAVAELWLKLNKNNGGKK